MQAYHDFRGGARAFEAWFDEVFLPENPFSEFSEAACVNTILIHLGRFLRIERGVLEFNKRAVVVALDAATMERLEQIF